MLQCARECEASSTLKSCSMQALLQLNDVPRGLCSIDLVSRPRDSTDANGLLLSLSKPVTVTWCPSWVSISPLKPCTPAW